MTAKRLRVAVIGVGNMGKKHARNYSEIDKADLVAVSDIDENLGLKVASQCNCRYYKDHNEMLDAEKLDGVSVVVPSRFHHRVGLDVIGHGVNILIEKPIAMTEAEAIDLIDAAHRANVKLMVGHVERFNPVVVRLKEVIDSGRLGKIVSITAKRVFVTPTQIRDANVLVDLAVHDIDLFSHILGANPNRVRANGGRAHLEDRDDHAEILLSYGDISGFIEVNWVTPVRIRQMTVTGTGGYAEVDYFKQTLTFYPSVVTKTVDDYNDLLVKFGNTEKVDIAVDKKQPLEVELDSFLASVANDTPVYTPGEDGLAALRVALKADSDIRKRS